MEQTLNCQNNVDEDGNPTGGFVQGTGLTIVWQNGPLGRGEDRLEPNGCFVEDLANAAIQRLQVFQDSKFACQENADALSCFQDALYHLNQRTERREQQGTEGTYAGS